MLLTLCDDDALINQFLKQRINFEFNFIIVFVLRIMVIYVLL